MKLAHDISAYQGVDILLGSNQELEKPPVPGWVVMEAGYYDRPQVFSEGMAVAMTESCDEATELYCYAVARSKYPDSVQAMPCWIHFQQRVFGGIHNRKFWTLR